MRNCKPNCEHTKAGSQTLLHGGVRPITERDRLCVLAAAPMRARTRQKQCDQGLFDLASHRQTDFIDELRRLNPKPQPSTKEKA
ncbi:MAG: hypothetical protein HKN14_07695 [Marinicaulis sp.]|nr:hypothetical protein [Marinicaulis sp.]NNL88331.1 hypothetical protein [Marinicaulis sp.]